MVKLLYIFSTLENSGPIKVHLDIIKNLSKNLFQIQIITLSEEPVNSLFSLFVKLDVPILCLKLNRLNWISEGIKKIILFNNSFKPDILHTQGIRADILSGFFIKHPNKFSTLHNFPYQEYAFTYGTIKGRIMAYIHIKALAKLNFTIVPSKSNQIQILKATKFKFNYILNGIDSELYKPVDKRVKDILKQKLGLPDKDLFIYVGQLNSRKDPLTIIEAFKTAKLSQACLIILGKGDLKPACLLAASTASNIKVLGFKKNVSDYVKASNYYISASKAEGLPLSVLEALGTGLPVILSKIMAHEEILSFSSNAGYLFEPGNEQELAKTMQDIVNTNYAFMSTQARKIVQDHLNDKIMSEAYQKIYLNSLEK